MTTTTGRSRRNRRQSDGTESVPTHKLRLVGFGLASRLLEIRSRIFLGLLLLPWLGACASPEKAEERPAAQRDQVQQSRVWHFDGAAAGKVPSGWRITETKPTKALATWRVTQDESAPSGKNVLALTHSENYNGNYNLAIAEKTSFKDIDLTVKVQGDRGEIDQGGGPIWRCRDENNYYICRFNPLEGNYRVYFVKDGRRKQLESAKIETEAGKWYTVRVTMDGDRITCYLDGKKLLEVQDDTFNDAGMVGLWTKADAVTRFDDLAVGPFVKP